MISSQLSSTIDDELRWRESELALAKIHLQRSLLDNLTFRYSYRCFAMLTYAHYEAFTKRVIAQSIQDIFDSGAAWSAFKPPILNNLFAHRFRQQLAAMSNEDLVMEGCSTSRLIDAVTPPPLSIILDCGNMNVTNFFWAVASIGLDPSSYTFARADIGRLTRLRHDCAHGEALSLDPSKTNAQLASDLYSLQSAIVLLMHSLAVDLYDHFARDGYLR